MLPLPYHAVSPGHRQLRGAPEKFRSSWNENGPVCVIIPHGSEFRGAVQVSGDIKEQIIGLLPRLRAMALSLAGRPDQADDLVQATCEKALRNLDRFQPGTRLDSWLARIMRNTWVDWYRARREQTGLDDDDVAAQVMGADGRRDTEARVMLGQVGRAMAALPQDQRMVLMLVCVEGLRYREVAALLDLPEGTVMSRLSRARQALATALGQDAHIAAGPRVDKESG